MLWLKRFFVHDLNYQSNQLTLETGDSTQWLVDRERAIGRQGACEQNFLSLCEEFDAECLNAAGQSAAVVS